MPRRSPPLSAAALLDRIADRPPSSAKAMASLVRRANPEELRRELIARLVSGRLGGLSLGIFSRLFEQLGPGDQRQRLETLVLDGAQAREVRARAAYALYGEDPHTYHSLAESLPEEDWTLPVEASLSDALHLVAVDPALPEGLAEFLDALDDRFHEALADRAEEIRRRLGLAASTVYEPVLERPSLRGAWAACLEALVQEATADAARVLAEARDRAEDPDVRRRLQGAYLRAQSRRIDPSPERPRVEARAWATACDSGGHLGVMMALRQEDDLFHGAIVLLRHEGAIMQGVVSPSLPWDGIEQMRARLNVAWAPVPADQAAWLVERARQHGGATPDGARHAIALVAQALPAGEPDVTAVQPAPRPTLPAYRKLLAGRVYRGWGFTVRELAALDPPPGGRAQRSFTQAVRRFARLADYMARWHAWRGEQSAARLMAAGAKSLIEAPGDSPLFAALLEKSTGLRLPEEDQKEA